MLFYTKAFSAYQDSPCRIGNSRATERSSKSVTRPWKEFQEPDKRECLSDVRHLLDEVLLYRLTKHPAWAAGAFWLHAVGCASMLDCIISISYEQLKTDFASNNKDLAVDGN